MHSFLIILTLCASLSPLLTFAHLWQIKEWRIDRLREHVKETHWCRLLLDIYRPLRYPVWTKKATALVCTSLALTGALSFELLALRSFTIIFIPLLQPLFLLLSWTIWKPVDHVCKQRILNHAKRLRSQCSNLTVIGITGSVGKTTTKELLKHILADKNSIATPEYVNTELGVAQWLIKNVKCKMKNSKLLIIELGAYRKGEIKTLCEIVQPTIGIITWIGRQHLGLFGSQKNIVDAKGELFEALPKNGHAFVSAETPFVEELKKQARCQVTVVESGMKNQELRISLAVSVSKHLGMSQREIDQKINTFTPPPHTFSIRTESGVTVLDDTHNASPESFKAVVAWARSRKEHPKILLTPGIIELGTARNQIHEELGKASKGVFDRVIFLNTNSVKPFERGFQKPVETYSKKIEVVPQGSLMVCIGRMPERIIHTLLP